MINEIEILVCVAVVLSLVLEAFPRLANAIEHAVVVLLVTLAAWPMYAVMLLRPPATVRPPAAQR
jgi:hypothetical protein